MGSLGVRHDWATSLVTFLHWRRKWQPTPVFLPGESQGRGAWWAASMGSHRVGHDWSDSAAAAAATVIYIALVKENTFITTNTKITQWTLTLKFYGKKGNEWSEQKYRSSWLKALPFKYTSAKARLLYIQISHSKVTAVDRWDLSSRRIKAAQQVVIIWSIMAVRLV